ncbi:uncharacterized protein LOC130800428 [Amaranthus tricolor]|uniref:uncharacterized protein LOC130800428 n=1 Tax=Amaranthus tricolor TaxID=29722 RepID=UPI00258F7020|nr:uncharacterized protein LOC130800428 [Amaranthus tricolor]
MEVEVQKSMVADTENTPSIQNPTQNQNQSESPSNSQGSSTHPSLSPPLPSQPSKKEVIPKEEFAVMDNDGPALPDKKPQFAGNTVRCFTENEILKYDKYEANYASYLREKYFSDKDINGGSIFDLAVTIDNETIKSSRLSPTRTYADPARGFDERSNGLASRVVDMSPNCTNGDVNPQKNSSSS